MSAAASNHRPRSVLSGDDAKELSWYLHEGQCAFERSTFGPMLDRAEMFGQALMDDENKGLYRFRKVTGKNGEAARWIGKVTTGQRGGAQQRSQPREPDRGVLERYAMVSRRLYRLQGVMIGDPPVSAADVFAIHDGDEGSQSAMGKGGRIQSLCHLTAPGAKMVARARENARSVTQDMAVMLKLKPQEVAFVMALRPHVEGRHAAVTSGYDAEGSRAKAEALLKRKEVVTALQWRHRSELLLGLKDPEVYVSEVGRKGNGIEKAWRRRMASAAMDQANELYGAACRAWNEVGKVPR